MSTCPSCNQEYSEEFRLPKMLPCGHTCCLICIYEVSKHHQPFICQECMRVFPNSSLLEKQPPNYTVLKFIQQMKAQQFPFWSPSNIYASNTTYPFPTPNSTNYSSPHSYNAYRNLSPSKKSPYPSNNSFDFNPLKMNWSNISSPDVRFSQKSVSEPRKDRIKTHPKKINDIEIHERGIFREKSPHRIVEVCSIKSCNNQKMNYKGVLQPFCSFHCAQFYNSSNTSQQEFQTPDKMFRTQGFAPSGNSDNIGGNNSIPMTTSAYANYPSFIEKANTVEFDSSQDSNKSRYKVGRSKPLDLLQYYEETPAPKNNKIFGMINSSLFSGLGAKHTQDNSLQSNNPPVNMDIRTPFDEVSNYSQQNESENSNNIS